MKTFLPLYLALLLLGTAAIDLYMPAFAADAPPVVATPDNPPPPVAHAEPLRIETPRTEIIIPQTNPRKLPPLPENLRPSGRHQAWGLTKTRVSTSEGDLQGGTFLEYPDVNATPLNAFYFARGQWNGPVVVPAELVTFFGGTLADAEPEHLLHLQRYFSLRGQLDNPQPTEVAAPAPMSNAPVNPHEEEYKAIAKQYLEFQERSKALTAQRDTARGAARDKIINELRVMKQDEAALVKKLEAAKLKYNDWKAKNPAPAPMPTQPPAPGLANTLDPARAAEIRAELKQLEPEVRKILGN